MKKILFLSAAAALVLASCSNEETVKVPEGNAISFGNAFVNNSTRAEDLSNENLANFAVYGYMAGMSGQIFNNVEVTKGEGNSWTYTGTQYWTPGQNYWFAAVAPYGVATFAAPTLATGLPTGNDGTITFDNLKGDVDLCAAFLNYTAKDFQNDVQAFTFGHLLSRVKFTFVNDMANAGAELVISDVKIEKTNTAGTYDCATKVWTASSTTNDVVYVNAGANIKQNAKEATEPMYLIPGDDKVEYKVVFTVKRMQGGEEIGSYIHTATISNVALELGKSYNFTATINDQNVDPETTPEPIVFSGTVSDWAEVDETTLPALK